MDFGDAIRALKSGRRVTRKGWHGKKMHLYLEESFVFPVKVGAFAGAKRTYDSCIVMFTAEGHHQPGWLASQADMLATDWIEVL